MEDPDKKEQKETTAPSEIINSKDTESEISKQKEKESEEAEEFSEVFKDLPPEAKRSVSRMFSFRKN